MIRRMKFVAFLLLAMAMACATMNAAPNEKKPFVKYAELIDTNQVELSDGSVWIMDKGDCFPIHMFKDRRTVVILKIATATFMVPAYQIREMRNDEQAKAEANYQRNVDNYWKAVAKRDKTNEAAAPK
jgi:ferric-dicitrate binding protein FerR (iron transport regulator)